MKSNDAVIRLVVFLLVGVALAAVTGRLSEHSVNDTPSYLNYPLGSLPDAMLSIRTPGYPVFLAAVSATIGLSMVPLLQVLLHSIASWLLGEELLSRGMPTRSALAASFCVLVGCTAADHINTISTDAPAASLGLIAAVLLMRACRTGSKASAIGCAVLVLVTIFVRPAYLFLIPWTALAGWLLVKRRCGENVSRSVSEPSRFLGLKIALSVSVAVFGWMCLRKLVVSDFGIVPFGHQNLSAILVQTVPPSTLRELPGEAGQLGQLVADELEKQGFELPSQARRSIPTLTLESQWGQINYGVVWPVARDSFASQDAIGVIAPQVLMHRRIGAMNRSILFGSPGGYIRWLFLAARRAVWGTAANIAMHPVFLILILFGMIWLVIRATREKSLGPISVPDGWEAFAIVAISYAILGVGFVILSSPPLGRFADATAIFLPALIVCLLVSPPVTSR